MLSEAVLSVDRTGLPYFVVMVDDSASQGVVDQYADPATKEATAELAKAAGGRRSIGWPGARVPRPGRREVPPRVAEEAPGPALPRVGRRPPARRDRQARAGCAGLSSFKKVEPSGDQSRLGAGIRQVLTELRGVPPTAIVLLTDGQTTDGETVAKAAEFAARKEVPLFPIGLGDPDAPRDIELSELLVDDVVFVDDLVRFQPKLTAKGFAGQELTVRLKQRTSPPGATEATRSSRSSRSRPRPTARRPGWSCSTAPRRPGR